MQPLNFVLLVQVQVQPVMMLVRPEDSTLLDQVLLNHAKPVELELYHAQQLEQLLVIQLMDINHPQLTMLVYHVHLEP